MKKYYTLLLGLVLSTTIAFSQSFTGFQDVSVKLTEATSEQSVKSYTQPKAFGDTIFYDDFSSGTPTTLPTGWTTVDNTANGFQWIWSNAAPGGQYSTGAAALASPTGTNGFLQLPCDLYNTPFPGGVPVNMSTWVQSPSFAISPTRATVIVEWYQSQRYCCNPANELVMEVSTDGINWSTPYDATNGRSPNTGSPNAEIISVNVSADLGNQTTGYVRFRSDGNSHYYWQIDDLWVYEGASNAYELEDWEMTFHNNYFYAPVYKQLPIQNISPAIYTGAIWNTGANTQTNVSFDLVVINDSAIGGGAGTGVVHTASDPVGTTLSGDRDTAVINNPFFSFNTGWFRNRVSISSDSSNSTPQAAFGEYTFALTADTSMVLDRGPGNYLGSTGPAQYVIGGQDNDALANLMILDSAMGATVLATSVSIYVANRADNDQVQVSPRVWEFQEDSLTGTLGSGIIGVVANSPFSETLDTNDFNTWVTLPIFPPRALGPGQYYYGVEQTGGATTNNAFIYVARDQGQEEYMGVLSTVAFLNDPTSPAWTNTGELAAIRFNGVFPAVGVEENAVEDFGFEVYPNPNEGQFTLRANSTTPTTYILNVRNMVGQTVMSDALNVNGVSKKQIDLSSYDKGVYFVTLENGSERLVKKVVVK